MVPSQTSQTSLTAMRSRALQHFAIPSNWKDLLDLGIFPDAKLLLQHWETVLDCDEMDVDSSPPPMHTPSSSSNNLRSTPPQTPRSSSHGLDVEADLLLTPASSSGSLYAEATQAHQDIVEPSINTSIFALSAPSGLPDFPNPSGTPTVQSIAF